MLKVTRYTIAVWFLALGGFFAEQAKAQSDDVAVVKTKFGNLNRAAAEAQGWKVDALCVDATSLGMSAESGAMGFHASMSGHEMGMMGMLDPMQPQELVFDADGKIVAVEYQVPKETGKPAPTLFGQTFQDTPPHVGMEMNHWSLHLWLIDNPGGPFAMFNPSVRCPADRTALNISNSVSMPGEALTPTMGPMEAGGMQQSGRQSSSGAMPPTGEPGEQGALGLWLLLAVLTLLSGVSLFIWNRRSGRRSGNGNS